MGRNCNNLSSTWELLREEQRGPLPLRSSREKLEKRAEGKCCFAQHAWADGKNTTTCKHPHRVIKEVHFSCMPTGTQQVNREPGNWLLSGLAVLLLAWAERHKGKKELRSGFKKQAQRSKWRGNSTPGSLLQNHCAMFTPSFS